MRLVVPRKRLQTVLRWSRRVLFAASVLMLAYCAFVLTDAWMFQKAERRQLDRLLPARPASLKHSPPPVPHGLIGRMEIPRIGLSVMVMEGTSRTTLRRAAGHIPGTALPGQPGNVGISGHRDTFFRPLRNIRPNDIITLTTLLGDYCYRVVSTRVVGPYEVAVLDSSGDEALTLVTCYPFYFVGSAPNRFIVRAERIT